MKVGFVFPGQGSQYVGMGKDIYEDEQDIAGIFTEADETLHFSLSRLCFYGPEEELTLTTNAQPAILTVSYALWKLLDNKGIEAHFVAGHSLGEYTALVVSGAVAFNEAVQLVRKRGRYMQEAVPVGQGAMAAIIGLQLDEVDKICMDELKDKIVSPANYNSQDQVVISGETNAVNEASERAKIKGAKRVIPLKVSAPFHSPLMKPAEIKMQEDIYRTVFKDLKIPLFNNVDASLVEVSSEAKKYLIRQITAPVKWYQIIMNMKAKGVDTFVEIGPGKVLTGLIKRICPDCRTYNIQDRKSLDETFNSLIELK
ncbi:MAG: [acyl-carrier-protein] S-malonyltransferase [Candidatus Fischerbacteria bacterium RBG_13_37_8]|uniref:Malonyl CoA-acyl carrier protein transacylase n=1 Tax=Candidatus Fischerbacteria bacterium RBG_13_37_8 TaxID=1817863 RepID=A0A1F5VFP7_9BACT|nr:MAG: [acyl-carrier-protein] S-malonyltransferase [Candidatus Fischerbacteria bacterium RBG_13_37_8]